MPDVFYGEWLEIVFLEEIIGAEAKQLKGNTNMAVVVKRVQYVYTSTRGGGGIVNAKSVSFEDKMCTYMKKAR